MHLPKQMIALPNGETLAYVQAGTGERVLVLIHGNLSSSYHWLPLIDVLKDQYTIYAFDLRGMGDSTYQNRFDDLGALASDISLALDALLIKKYVVAGWSAGGGVAMLLASRDQRVEKLILLASMSYKGLPVYRKDQDGKILFGSTYSTKEALAQDKIQVMPILQAVAKQDEAYMKWLWQAVIYTVNQPDASFNDILIKESLKQRNLVDLDWAIMHFNIGAGKTDYAQGNLEIKKINVPVLSIWGRQDKTVWEAMVRETAFVLGQLCSLKIYDQCGHSPVTDQLAQLSQDIQAFIS
jgi:2-hydroxy-6-oxonona-2,4-dienedioate hydrolase